MPLLFGRPVKVQASCSLPAKTVTAEQNEMRRANTSAPCRSYAVALLSPLGSPRYCTIVSISILANDLPGCFLAPCSSLSLSPPAASQLLLASASHALEQVAVEMRFPDFIPRRFQTKLCAPSPTELRVAFVQRRACC